MNYTAVSYNHATTQGGGIYSTNKITIVGGSFTANTAGSTLTLAECSLLMMFILFGL